MVTKKFNFDKKFHVRRGKNKGIHLCKMMIVNYGFLPSKLKDLNDKLKPYDKKSNYLIYLEKLLENGENRPVEKYCPVCKIHKVSQILVSKSSKKEILLNINHISCSNAECMKEIEEKAEKENLVKLINTDDKIEFINWLEPKFSEIKKLGQKPDQDRFVNLLLMIFDFSERSSTQKIIEFFSK